MSKKAAETVVTVIDDDGIGSLISELSKASVDSEVCSFYHFLMCICCFPFMYLNYNSFLCIFLGVNEEWFFLSYWIFFQVQQVIFD